MYISRIYPRIVCSQIEFRIHSHLLSSTTTLFSTAMIIHPVVLAKNLRVIFNIPIFLSLIITYNEPYPFCLLSNSPQSFLILHLYSCYSTSVPPPRLLQCVPDTSLILSVSPPKLDSLYNQNHSLFHCHVFFSVGDRDVCFVLN